MTNRNNYNSLILGLVLFSFAFLISRAQFFACPTVEIQNDSGEYVYWIDAYLSKGEMPPCNYIPIGYPVIVKALTLVKDSVYSIVFFQIALTFCSFSLLLFVVWRFYSKYIYWITVACIAVYVQIPNSLFFDIYLLSESCYNSTLVLLVAGLIAFFNQPTKKNSVLLSIALTAPILFRPTGAFTIVMFALTVLYLIRFNKREFLIAFFSPFLLVYFILSTYSLCVSGDPIFIGHSRITRAITNSQKNEIQTPLTHQDSLFLPLEKMNRWQRTLWLYANYTKQSQMYSRIEEANDKYFKRNFPKTNEWTCCYFGWIDTTMVKERKAVFKEFYYTDKMRYLADREQEVKKTKLFKLYDLFSNKIIKKLFLNFFWIALMFASLLFASVVLLQTKFNNYRAIILLFLVLINIGTYAPVIVAGFLPLPRYGYPAEFIFLLQLPFLIDLIQERRNAFK